VDEVGLYILSLQPPTEDQAEDDMYHEQGLLDKDIVVVTLMPTPVVVVVEQDKLEKLQAMVILIQQMRLVEMESKALSLELQSIMHEVVVDTIIVL
jgi:hypothetical protein